MSRLLPFGKRVAREAVGKAMAGGLLALYGAPEAGVAPLLVEFRLPDRFVYDEARGAIVFAGTPDAVVRSMGSAAAFVVLAKDSRAPVIEGSAGKRANGIADIPLDTTRLFQGMRASIDGLEYVLEFVDEKGA